MVRRLARITVGVALSLLALLPDAAWAGPQLSDPPPDGPPQIENQVWPTYPRWACTSGTVVLRVGVDAQGRVVQLGVVESVPELDEAAIDAVRQWTFKPARRRGAAVPGETDVRVRLQLSDSPEACEARIANMAQTMAEDWLKLLDRGKYKEAWEKASRLVRSEFTEAQWEERTASLRAQGKMKTRTLTSRTVSTAVPGVPKGRYVVLEFATSFGKSADAVETVIAALEFDGTCRVAAYSVR
jgi:serine/threonine-protein kinase